MLKVIAEDFIAVNQIHLVRPYYAELVELTRQEPDCIAYELFEDLENPGHFVFIEEWPDRAALDRHCATEHFQRLVPQIDAHSTQPGRVTQLTGFGQS